jgi:nicotinate-nucleotide pyrophosphorylase (carboxylating)
VNLDPEIVRATVETALREDLGSRGDITTDAVFSPNQPATAHLVARSRLVLAGLPVAREVFRTLDPSVELETLREDGERLEAGTRIASLRGPARAILKGERTALNFLMRMSGIAGAAAAACDEIAGTGATILDTRKTAPGLRHLDKYAVAAGGATNHRLGLWDAAMLKDTHLDAMPSIAEAVARVLDAGHPPERVTVEVRTIDGLREAIAAGVGRALLDNMSVEKMREAVRVGKGRIVLEASGGLRPGRLREIAETGVDCLSLGWLTHSAPAADIAMETEARRS